MADKPETQVELGEIHPTRELAESGPRAAPLPVPPPDSSPVDDGNGEFPVAFRHFAAALRGTDDEVWTRYIQIRHGRRNMTMTEWRRTHDSLRHEHAHWHRG